MKPIEEMTLSELEDALKDVEKGLQDKARLLWQQRALICQAIEMKRRETTEKYAGWRRTKAVMDIVQPGVALSKKQILEIMEGNGLPKHPVHGSQLNNDAINYLLETGKLQTEDGVPLGRRPKAMELRVKRVTK